MLGLRAVATGTEEAAMSFGKLTRFAYIFYQWQIRNAITVDYLPEEVSIEATNVCNFRCAFCPQSDPAHHEAVPRGYLAAETAERLLRRLREGGVKTKVLHWTLDGEPFMNKDFHRLCAVALKWDFDNMYFATNGMLLTEDIIGRLPSGTGVKYTFTIDFAADAEYFEEVRGSQNSWRRIVDNIAGILANPSWPHLRIEMQDISTYRFADPVDLQRRFEDLKKLFSDPYGRLRLFHKTFHNATGLVDTPVPTSATKKYHLCPYPWTSLFVASNGDIVACCRDLRRQTVLGNLLVQTLPEIWNGRAFQQLRRNLVDRRPEQSAVCDGCDLPYDDAKFSWRNILRVAKGRLQIIK